MTSVIGIGLSCTVSVAVPFFDIIVAAIGALGDLAAAYALPALFVLVRSDHDGHRDWTIKLSSQNTQVVDVLRADHAQYKELPESLALMYSLHAAAELRVSA